MASYQWYRPRLATAAGVWLILYYLILIPVRYGLKGKAGLYDLLWGCNFTLLMGATGCFLKNRLVVATSLTMVAFAHMSWCGDALTWMLTGDFPIGTSSYIAWPETTYLEIASTLHHVWFIPLMFTVLYGNGGIPFKTVPLTVLCSIGLMLIGRTFTPIECDGIYLNVNMAHEVWKDTPIALLQKANELRDSQGYHVYVVYVASLANTINFVCYLVMRLIFMIVCGEKSLGKSVGSVSAAGKKAKKDQ